METSRHPPPGAATRHPKLGNYFPIDSVIGASNIRPPTDATQSRPYLRPQPIIQFPFSNLSIRPHVNKFL